MPSRVSFQWGKRNKVSPPIYVVPLLFVSPLPLKRPQSATVISADSASRVQQKFTHAALFHTLIKCIIDPLVLQQWNNQLKTLT